MNIKSISKDWASITLTKDETWVVNSGDLIVSTDPSPNRTGTPVGWGAAVPFRAGQTVFYRRRGSIYTEVERLG